MTLSYDVRKLIKSHFESGKNANQIYHLLNRTVTRSTIYSWVNKLKNEGSIAAIKQPGRPRSVRTPKFIKNVAKKVFLNKKPKTPQQIANDMGCSRELVRLTIRDD